MSLLRRLFGGGEPARQSFEAPLAPEQPFYAVGDIHGRDDLLARLLDKIDAAEPEAMIVCVGDYVDRGEQSADVLRRLHARATAAADRFVCLMGNHEEMMLNFLDTPEEAGPRWLRYGGLQTLASFGLRGLTERSEGAALTDARGRLRDGLLAPELEAWLRALPRHWQSGNVAVVHAAADPDLPMEEQPDKTLIWGHPRFEHVARKDGIWVVHGHTIVDAPLTAQGRIPIDTGAYATGRLTAARIMPGGPDFVQA